MDANGILSVKAKDKKTGREQSVRIEASSGLTEDEVERMKREAEANADSDKKKRELVDARNEGDRWAHDIEKQLTEQGDKVPANVKGEIEASIAELRSACEGEDKDKITAAMTALQQKAQKLAQAAQAGAQAGPAGPEASEAEGDDEAVDADFEVKS